MHRCEATAGSLRSTKPARWVMHALGEWVVPREARSLPRSLPPARAFPGPASRTSLLPFPAHRTGSLAPSLASRSVWASWLGCRSNESQAPPDPPARLVLGPARPCPYANGRSQHPPHSTPPQDPPQVGQRHTGASPWPLSLSIRSQGINSQARTRRVPNRTRMWRETQVRAFRSRAKANSLPSQQTRVSANPYPPSQRSATRVARGEYRAGFQSCKAQCRLSIHGAPCQASV